MCDDTESFFENKTRMYQFILTKTDGRQRMDLLGVGCHHYQNKYLANQWAEQIKLYLNDGSAESTKALDKLNALHSVMVDFQ